jgi:hypothetical protein
VRRSSQAKLVHDLSADLEHLTEVPLRLPEVLAKRQQDHMLVVRVQVVRVLRSSKRISSPLQDPLLSSHDANQFMLVRFLPIPRHRAIPPWRQDNSLRNWLVSREGPCCADVSTFPECRFSRVSTEHSLGKDHRGGKAMLCDVSTWLATRKAERDCSRTLTCPE